MDFPHFCVVVLYSMGPFIFFQHTPPFGPVYLFGTVDTSTHTYIFQGLHSDCVHEAGGGNVQDDAVRV